MLPQSWHAGKGCSLNCGMRARTGTAHHDACSNVACGQGLGQLMLMMLSQSWLAGKESGC